MIVRTPLCDFNCCVHFRSVIQAILHSRSEFYFDLIFSFFSGVRKIFLAEYRLLSNLKTNDVPYHFDRYVMRVYAPR